jgi:putative membrane protein
MTHARLAATALTALCLVAAPATAAHAEPSVSDADVTFVKTIHQGNLAEIAAGEDAGANAVSDCVKEVGAALVRDHGRLDEQLTALAEQLDITLPDAPTPEQQQQLAELQEKAGTEAYDTGWLAAQEAAHEQTLELIDQEVEGGTNEEVKAAAEAARPVVEMHLESVRGGTCRGAAEPASVPAGHGRAPEARDTAGDARAATLTGGVLLALAGTAAWLTRGRRTSE